MDEARGMTQNGSEPRKWVPLALPEDEAQAVFDATRAVFHQLIALGEAASPGGARLARGMLKLAEACDKAREKDPAA